MSSRLKWRRRSSLLLLIAGCIILPFAVVSIWLDYTITDTGRYVETVAPLSSNEAIAEIVADSLTETIFEEVSVEENVEEALPQEGAFLAGPLTGFMQDFTRETTRDVIKSDKFNSIWIEANRTAHSAVISMLLGEGEVLTADEGKVTLDLNPLVDDVKEKLSESGVNIFDDVQASDVGLQYTLAESQTIADAQELLGTLQKLAWVLPFIVLAFWAGSVILSLDRRKTIFWLGFGISTSIILLLLTLFAGRSLFINEASGADASSAAAEALYDTLVRFLVSTCRWIFVSGLLVIFAAWLSGPSEVATGVRKAIRSAVGGIGK